MILGASLFDTVVERVGRDKAAVTEPGPAFGPRFRGLGGLFAAPRSAGPNFWQGDCDRDADSAQYFNETYFAFMDEAGMDQEVASPGKPDEAGVVASAKPGIDSSVFARLTVEEIRADLRLERSDTSAALRAKRREFARLNHPDRVPEKWREAATIRMKTANQLVDQALKTAGSSRP